MGWFAIVLPLIAALGLLWVPGLLVLAPLRMGRVARFALAGAVSVMSLGLAGVVFGSVGIGFAAWQPFVPAGVLVAVTFWLATSRGRVSLPVEPGRRMWIVLMWAGASVAIATVAFAAVPDPDRISQTYDNIFHLSAIASILDGDSASSLTLRTLIETDRGIGYYPSGWHSLVAAIVQVTGVGVPTAANAAWVGVCAAVWLPGVAWLAQVTLHRLRPDVVALVALPLGASFGWMPYGLLGWGTLYPTFLGTALLPAAVAIPVLTWLRLRNAHVPSRVIVMGSMALAVGVSAIAFAQPRVLASWVLVVAPAALGVLAASAGRLWRAGGRARQRMLWVTAVVAATAVLAAGGALLYLVNVLGLFDRPLDQRLGGPQAEATQSIVDGVLQVLSVSTMTGVGGAITAPALGLAAAVAVGAIAAMRTRGLRWIVVTYALIAFLFALAAGSDDVLAKLATALWYKDRFRLAATLPVLGVVLATLGVIVVGRYLARVTRARSTAAESAAIPVALGVLVSATAIFTIGLSGTTTSIASVFRLPPADDADGTALITQKQLTFLATLPDTVPADQLVLGDPWDGSTLSWSFGDRRPVFPHVNGQWDREREVLAWQLAEIETNPEVCRALDDLRVRYVVYSPRAFAGGDPAGSHFPGPHAAVEAGLFDLVSTDGESGLYRIDQCGPLP